MKVNCFFFISNVSPRDLVASMKRIQTFFEDEWIRTRFVKGNRLDTCAGANALRCNWEHERVQRAVDSRIGLDYERCATLSCVWNRLECVSERIRTHLVWILVLIARRIYERVRKTDLQLRLSALKIRLECTNTFKRCQMQQKRIYLRPKCDWWLHGRFATVNVRCHVSEKLRENGTRFCVVILWWRIQVDDDHRRRRRFVETIIIVSAERRIIMCFFCHTEDNC